MRKVVNYRKVISTAPRSVIESINEKYNCIASVQIREVSDLGGMVRKEFCRMLNIDGINGWGINKNGWKHSKRTKNHRR